MELIYTARPSVQTVEFSKGLTINLNAPYGHDIEIVSLYTQWACDATVATRHLDLKIWTGADGTGSLLQYIFSTSPTASQSNSIQGPINTGGGSATFLTTVVSLVVPGSGSLHMEESSFVAGDTWSARVLYRIYPVYA